MTSSKHEGWYYYANIWDVRSCTCIGHFWQQVFKGSTVHKNMAL